MYRCVATSADAFVQQLAVGYLRNGYWFYVYGRIPPTKAVEVVDHKLMQKYHLDISKWARARRKQTGGANMQYLRHNRFFVLLATHGHHVFFEEEAKQIRDARRCPIRFAGYAISYRGGHAHVRIDLARYRELKAYFEQIALQRSTKDMVNEFNALRFLPYAPVRRQLLNLQRAVNRIRQVAGYELIPAGDLPLKRRVIPGPHVVASNVSR